GGGAVVGDLRTNLPEHPAIEGQHTFRGADDEQLLVVRVGQQPGGQPQQRTWRQLLSGAIVLEQLAALVVLQHPSRPADNQMSLQDGSAGKRRWRADPGKSIVRRALESDDGEAMLPLELEFLLRSFECSGRLPVDQSENCRSSADQYGGS